MRYIVKYRMYNGAPVEEMQIDAMSVNDAHSKATYDVLGTGEHYPYSVWVTGRIDDKGIVHWFDVQEGEWCQAVTRYI